MKHAKGQTLIELVVFILIISLILDATLRVFKSVLFFGNRPAYLLTASQLAEARMNMIILQRHSSAGFAGITDPCSSGSVDACSVLNTFANSNGYTVSSSIPAADNGVRIATVTVSGTGNATAIIRFVCDPTKESCS